MEQRFEKAVSQCSPAVIAKVLAKRFKDSCIRDNLCMSILNEEKRTAEIKLARARDLLGQANKNLDERDSVAQDRIMTASIRVRNAEKRFNAAQEALVAYKKKP